MLESIDNTNLYKLESHRFQIPGHSGEVLHAFRKEMSVFIAKHPELIGITVYGSQVKGTARTEDDPQGKSDVDAFIFIDEDATGLPIDTTQSVDDKSSDNWHKINESIGKPFKKIFSQTSGYSEQELKDVRVRLISKARIDNDLLKMIDYLSKLRQFESRNGERPTFEDRPVSPDLARLFHLQLGQDLDPYRTYVLIELKKLGDLGDEIWETFFYQDTISQENGKLIKGMSAEAIEFQNKRIKLFPHTIDDAIKYFQLESVKQKYSSD